MDKHTEGTERWSDSSQTTAINTGRRARNWSTRRERKVKEGEQTNLTLELGTGLVQMVPAPQWQVVQRGNYLKVDPGWGVSHSHKTRVCVGARLSSSLITSFLFPSWLCTKHSSFQTFSPKPIVTNKCDVDIQPPMHVFKYICYINTRKPIHPHMVS